MPDFDSIDQNNRHLVLEWLPHIDVLIYVVSPERYRDEKAWRLLFAEGGAACLAVRFESVGSGPTGTIRGFQAPA